MKQLWNLVLKGLAAILPIGVTIYVVIWLATSVEAMLRDVITLVLPERHYWPGLGLLIVAEWPASGLWVIGMFLGIDLLFSGTSLIMFAFGLRNLAGTTRDTTAGSPGTLEGRPAH